MQSKHKRNLTLGLILSIGAGLGAGGALVSANPAAKVTAPRMMEHLSPEAQAAIQSANNLSTAFRSVAEHMLPSLVTIENRPVVATQAHTRRLQPSADPHGGANPFKGTPFEDMFRDLQRSNPGGQMIPKGYGMQSPPPSAGMGSGVIIDASGIILTNNHVVAGGGEVTVKTHDGRKFVATQVWTDPDTDIAVVKIDGADDLVPATLGDSEAVEIGDWVIAMGQPFGLESSVTAGIISAKHRGIGITNRENFLQTDAAINPGNSGGPLVNLAGEVIGINTAISSRGGGNDGIGFAVPSNLARWVSDQLRENGTVKRAYLGVGIQPVSQELAAELGVKPFGGVAITDVYDNTPAKEMGLKPGDVIVEFAGESIKSPQALQLAVERSAINSEVPVKVVRDGKTMEMTYRGTEVAKDFVAMSHPESESSPAELSEIGIGVEGLTSEIAKSLGVDADHGVVVTSVTDGSAGDRSGLVPGMVIVEVDRKPIHSVDEFEKAMAVAKESDGSTLLLVRSAKGSRFIVLKRS
ncbi:MAG: Do family serine endopeptidase [Planctomycetales bacterium]|nr:Do family serine endopeptidase [Planctomycetales bacterium]